MITLAASSQQRILIIRLSALGDVAYALPALSALRRHCPRAHVAWAVEEAALDLLKDHPQLDELIVVPRKAWQKRLKRGGAGALVDMWRFRRALHARRFDVAIDFQGNLRSALVTAASGARCRIGFAPPGSREHSHRVLHHAAAVDPALHKVERNLALLRAIGVDVEEAEAMFPPPSAEDVRAADDLLRSANVAGPFVLIHPGVSKFGSYKQWPAGNYAELARSLQERGAAVLVSAGPGEEQLAGGIAAEAPGVVPVSGLGLSQLIELIRRAAAFIASDTGPAQIAWLLGTPTVAMMGPKDPRIYGPLGDRHRKLTVDLPCRPCTRRKCDDNRCMKEIATEDVLNAAISIMKTNASA